MIHIVEILIHWYAGRSQNALATRIGDYIAAQLRAGVTAATIPPAPGL